MNSTITYIHGCNHKPKETDLHEIIFGAMEFAIRRDHPSVLSAFRSSKKQLLYYGDLIAGVRGVAPRPLKSLADRMRRTLGDLITYGREDYLRRRLPDNWRYWLMKLGGLPLHLTNLAPAVICRSFPEVVEYWRGTAFRSSIQNRSQEFLQRNLGGGCVITHSFGSLVFYDACVATPEMAPVDRWLTLGSPIAVECVKTRLEGWQRRSRRRYPRLIRHWRNFAGVGDPICADPTVADDFVAMRRRGHVESIVDHQITNLATRDGQHDPHSSLGYLCHPLVAAEIAAYLAG